MKIRVNGIFDRYNNEVDVDKKCNILIGENGIGKSTTLKIVKAFLSGDFVELLKYYFNSIEVIDHNKNVKINYVDLFPKANDILNITNEYVIDSSLEKESSWINYNKCDIEKYNYKLLDLVEENPNCYTHLIRNVINDGNKFSMDGFREEYNITNNSDYLRDASYILNIFYLRFINVKDYNNIRYIDNTEFSKNESYKTFDEILKNYNRVFLISAVKEIDIVNDVFNIPNKYFSINDDFRILDSYKKEENDILKRVPRDIRKREDFENKSVHLSVEEMERFYNELFNKYSVEEIINNTIYENIYKDYDVYKDLGGFNNSYRPSIDIKKILFKNYYSEDVLRKFTRDYYTMLKKMVNREYSAQELDLELCFDNSDIMNKYYIFMEPLIPRYSFYRSFLLGSNKTSYYSYEAQVFNKFILDNLDYYVNYENDKIKILNYLLSEYFKNKKIYCSPNGLIISDNKDFKNRYNFKYLSEGEKKVILLLIISVFNDNDVLILDEVETSLSVIWQKRLINDLLKEGNIDHLIVSTQSPFIVDDDALFENVVCLPGDVNYE